LVAQDIVTVPTGDRVLEPSVTEMYRVGSMAGADWETFADVRSVAFDATGNLYILDGDNHRVVVTDRGGRLLRQFGKEGDGPGELRMPFGMVVSPEGVVAVLDLGHQAFVIYDVDGRFVRNARNDFETGLMTQDLEYHPRSGAVGIRSGFSMGPGAEESPGDPVRFVPFSEGAEVEDLAIAWRAPVEMADVQVFGSEGGNLTIGGMPKLRAFDAPLQASILPDGRVALVDSTAYVIKLVDPAGGVGAILRRSITPRSVTKRDQDAEVERRRDEIEAEASGGGGNTMVMMGTSGGGGDGGDHNVSFGGPQIKEMLLGRLESMIFGDEIPVISRIGADKEGRIWVERTGRRVGEAGPTDVITAGGQYLGSVPLDGLRIPDAFGPSGLVAYVERDEYDVEYVAVRQLGGIGHE
jgi:hypothetical protein